MMETMPLPDLPASFSRAATGIRRSSPCAAAAFFVRAAQVITKPGPCARRRGLSSVTEFLPGWRWLPFSTRDDRASEAPAVYP